MKIKHPYGNTKSFLLKFLKFNSKKIEIFLGFIFKLDKYDEIIISPAIIHHGKRIKNLIIFMRKLKI